MTVAKAKEEWNNFMSRWNYMSMGYIKFFFKSLIELLISAMESSARKTTTRTHEGSKLLGAHIGVYQPCPALKRTLVAMSERTGMSVSQVTDEVLYTGLVEMQELDEL